MKKEKTRQKTKSSTNFGGGLLLILFFAILGYFLYGGIQGFFGIILLGIIMTILLILSLIPYIGGIIYLFLNWFFIIPAIMDFTGLWWTWFITIILILFTVCSMIISILVGAFFTIK